MKRFVFALFSCLGSWLSASDSPMLARLPATPLFKGSLDFEIGVRHFNREFWMDSKGELARFNGSYGMRDSDGLSKSVKGFQFDFKVLWAASFRDLIEISLPYYNQEFSTRNSTPWLPRELGDSTVRSADASGDLCLGWRRSAGAGSKKNPWRKGASFGLKLSAPTGQGPFASSHPLVATGNGGFLAAAELNFWHGRSFRKWIQFRVPHEFGYSADIAPGAFVAYRVDQPPQTLSGGRSWVSRAFSYDLIGGIAWHWHESDTARHSLALELQLEEKGAMRLDGVDVPDSASAVVNVVPQARFSFGKVLAINFGWLTPLGYASNRAVANWGELLLRVDYSL